MGSTPVRHAVAVLEAALDHLIVDDVPVLAAAELTEILARCERKLSARRLELARRATAHGAHRASGDRDPAAFLARLTGSSIGRAKDELSLVERLTELTLVRAAVQSGQVSAEQAKVIVPAAEANPGATEKLLAAATQGSFSELKALSRDTLRAARSEEDEVAREARVHRRRFCRTWAPPEGGLRIDAWLTAVDGGKLLAALTKRTSELVRAGATDPLERVRADALVALVDGVRTELTVRVDAAALRRGAVAGDEVCEIPGVGPVSVTAARSLLGGSAVRFLVTNGTDITTVTSASRSIARALTKALHERDQVCIVPGCGVRIALERDHRHDFAKGGPTELANMGLLCSVHHRMKSEGLLSVHGSPGHWVVATPRTRAGPTLRPVPPAGAAGRRPTAR